MATRAVEFWIQYVCLDSNNRPLSGDLAAHTIDWSPDAGGPTTCTNNQGGAGKHEEIGNGRYRLLLTAAETDYASGMLGGVSATSQALIVPTRQTFDASVRTQIGMATANLDTQLAAIFADTGSGARTVLVTVNDGTVLGLLESAKVRMTKGAETYPGTTNASGQVAFYLDDGTWAVTITLPLYTFAATTLVVDGNETPTYSMAAQSIPASAPGLVTGYLYCYVAGTATEGVIVTLEQTEPGAATGEASSGTARTATSGVTGLASFTGLVPGATYTIQRGTGKKVWRTIASNAIGSIALDSVVGVP